MRCILRVLIVDDHTLLRSAIRSELEDYDELEVVGEAANGEEAILRTRQLRPDLLITDINMPVLDGLTASEVIKKNTIHRHGL